MTGLCIEASHKRGLGHLFRAIHFAALLAQRGKPFVVFVNNDKTATDILRINNLQFEVVELDDCYSDWESALIRKHGITVWINDRLDTTEAHAKQVKKNGIPLITIDDRGEGAALADIHFAPLVFSGTDNLKGLKVLSGTAYLILNPDIEHHRRLRTRAGSILVTLGGSDTYGVTLRVVEILKRLDKTATIVAGPSFLHWDELHDRIDDRFVVKPGVASRIAEFALHDLAITGGGITPFEANASGLPCIIIANEPHELEIGSYLHHLGSSLFAGYHTSIDEAVFSSVHDIERMSRAGMEALSTLGAQNVYRAIYHA